jgi:hypothetical protein
MALSASVDTSKAPLELTIRLDAALAAKRTVDVDITILGETVHASAVFPIKVVDAERIWTFKSESSDGLTAVYTATA